MSNQNEQRRPPFAERPRPTGTWDLTLPSLKEAYKDHFLFGNIMDTWDFDDQPTLDMFAHHYNAMTIENSMKPINISSAKGVYDFSKADRYIEWAESKGIAVHGHCFLWHGQSAPWLNQTAEGEPLTRAEARENMESFISTYAGRYKGRIKSWDVLNEAMLDKGEYDGDWKAHMRPDKAMWFRAYANGAKDGEHGSDYVYDAFKLTRKYDPTALLYYNDYNEEIPPKRDAITDMVLAINEQWKKDPDYDNRLLIEGIGMQSHQNSKKDANLFEDAIKKYITTGCQIAVTELDYGFTEEEGVLTPELEEAQAKAYAHLFRLYKKYSKHIERVTFWGKADSRSWRFKHAPTLFDREFKAKKAFFAAIKPEDF